MGPSVLSAASSFPLLDPVDLRSFLEVFCFLALGSVSDMVDDCGVYLALGSLCCWLLVQLGLRFTPGWWCFFGGCCGCGNVKSSSPNHLGISINYSGMVLQASSVCNLATATIPTYSSCVSL